MENKQSFLGNKGLGWFLTVPAAACGIAGVFLYQKYGINAFNIELNQTLILLLWAAALIGAVSLLADFKALRYISYLLFLYDFIIYIGTQSKYITNVIVAIDGNTFTGGFIATTVCLLLAFVLMLIAALTTNTGKKTAQEEQ